MKDILLCNKEEANCTAIISEYHYCDGVESEDYKIIGKKEEVQKLVEAGYNKIEEFAKIQEFEQFVEEEHSKEEICDYIMSKESDGAFIRALESVGIVEKYSEYYDGHHLCSASIAIDYDAYDNFRMDHAFEFTTYDDVFESQTQNEENAIA